MIRFSKSNVDNVVFAGGADCGKPTDKIAIRDLGNATCVSIMTISGESRTGDCTVSPYTKTCSSFAGSLTIVMGADSPVAYQIPPINKHLEVLGLSNLVVIQGNLSILVDYTPKPVATQLIPVFLANLQQVGSLMVSECADCAKSTLTPPTVRTWPALAALPGLVNLKQTCNPTGPSCIGNTLIQIMNTGFRDLASLSGLTCPPSTLSLKDLTKLTSLKGLNALLPQPASGTVFDTTGSGPFADLNAILPIVNMANCVGNVSTSTSPFFLSETPPCDVPFFSYSQYCLFVSDTTTNTTKCPVGCGPIFRCRGHEGL